jgi:hypothetical protein
MSTETPSGLDLIWGARQIAKEINQTPRQTFHLLATGAIKSARRVGGRYTADRNALKREFGAVEAET